MPEFHLRHHITTFRVGICAAGITADWRIQKTLNRAKVDQLHIRGVASNPGFGIVICRHLPSLLCRLVLELHLPLEDRCTELAKHI
jgi:hypothetical protein